MKTQNRETINPKTMKPAIVVAICLMGFTSCFPTPTAREDAAATIRATLLQQQADWNEGNIESFMDGYWKSDSLQFVGKAITQGWQATLERYQKTYPDRAAMGQLTFDLWQIVPVDAGTYLVTGKYTLVRANDQPTGQFTLLVKKKNGKWVVVYDHTC
jgi:hypothetical protein